MDQDPTIWSASVGLCLLAFFMAMYFLGAIIGFRRDVRAKWALLLINGFLGWTVIGWIACVIWGVSGATKAQDAFYLSRQGH